MASENDVMAVLKGVSAKISPDETMVLSFMYHTELDPSDPEGKKKNRAKSQYRYEGRVVKNADLQKEIDAMRADPTAPWRWPGLDGWRISYDCEATNKRGAKWLADRLKKALDWETAKKVLDGWKRSSNDFKEGRKYDQTGYVADGKPFDITLDGLKLLGPGKTFTKVLQPKTGKKAKKAKTA